MKKIRITANILKNSKISKNSKRKSNKFKRFTNLLLKSLMLEKTVKLISEFLELFLSFRF